MKRWSERQALQPEELRQLQEEMGTNEIYTALIARRSLKTRAEVLEYFNPSLSQLHDPFLMQDMAKAVERIGKAVSNDELIIVYGDYDVDGTTSVALVYSYLRTLSENVLYYIPDRFKEGHGISDAGIAFAESRNCRLIIALDCGIKATEKVNQAAALGIDFIICDHHNPDPVLPSAVAVLNPHRPDCAYPFKDLSGCGIGFKLISAIAQQRNEPLEASQYVDLVALSIASDMVSMTGENRTLAFFGLEQINTAPRPGIKALIAETRLQSRIDIPDLVYKVCPRINAAGRMARGIEAVRLLTEDNVITARQLASSLGKSNLRRQNVDQATTLDAFNLLESDQSHLKRRTTVLYHKDWHQGVIGIVASRLIEKYHRPTVLFANSNGMAVGSARSVDGYNLYAALEKCSDLFEHWGGHSAAAGISLKTENIPEFAERFEKIVAETLSQSTHEPLLEYDMEIPLHIITPTFYMSISRFGPFGPGNPKPVFLSRGLAADRIKIVGDKHLKFLVQDQDLNTLQAYGFNLVNALPMLEQRKFNMLFTIEASEHRRSFNLMLYAKDIQSE